MATQFSVPVPAPRNAFALAARSTRSATFKDRRTPRGGTRNWARQWIDEGLDDDLGSDEQADFTSAGHDSGSPSRFNGVEIAAFA
jgi:hypothetical protein